jgi:murein DD-endopeptidase MepM/ murein hydrolase activator NlpD
MIRDSARAIPLIALGAAGAFALASLLRRRKESAAPGRRSASADSSHSAQRLPPLRLDFGRPVPADVRAVVASGWASIRGAGPTRRLHRGLDIGLPIGTPILTVDQGVVTFVQSEDIGDAGIWTAVRHPSGITSRYIHLSRTLVKVGQLVQRGERIGLSGDTASPGVPHLHLDLRAPAAMLPAIEVAIGRPRSGWGPEMKPFGHSIPGEPLIAVDAYRDNVRAEAAAMGIPLRNPSLPRNGARIRAVSYVRHRG